MLLRISMIRSGNDYTKYINALRAVVIVPKNINILREVMIVTKDINVLRVVTTYKNIKNKCDGGCY